MVTARLYFDCRRLTKEGLGHLRIMIVKNGKTAMMSLGISILPNQWNGDKVVNHPDMKFLNNCIYTRKAEIDRALFNLSMAGALTRKTPKEIIPIVLDSIDPNLAEEKIRLEEKRVKKEKNFSSYFKAFAETKKNAGTRGLYLDTYRKVKEYCDSIGQYFDDLTFEEITVQWIDAFEQHCLKSQQQNTASRHLRDIRAVFNAAINDGKTTCYPFRKRKIKVVATRDKSFSAEQLRSFFNANCYPGVEQEAVDIFKLMFCLIGINSVDLSNLNEIRKGRIDYTRRKTDKLYSIKVEPEAQELFEKYKGNEYLLNILERVPNYKTYFNRYGKAMRKVGKIRINGKKSEGSAILPDVCWGSARTSWATIAQDELDIDRETIAAALGHHTVDVTDTYLRTKWRKKVDEANRRVIDWVFYGKK